MYQHRQTLSFRCATNSTSSFHHSPSKVYLPSMIAKIVKTQCHGITVVPFNKYYPPATPRWSTNSATQRLLGYQYHTSQKLLTAITNIYTHITFRQHHSQIRACVHMSERLGAKWYLHAGRGVCACVRVCKWECLHVYMYAMSDLAQIDSACVRACAHGRFCLCAVRVAGHVRVCMHVGVWAKSEERANHLCVCV